MRKVMKISALLVALCIFCNWNAEAGSVTKVKVKNIEYRYYPVVEYRYYPYPESASSPFYGRDVKKVVWIEEHNPPCPMCRPEVPVDLVPGERIADYALRDASFLLYNDEHSLSNYFDEILSSKTNLDDKGRITRIEINAQRNVLGYTRLPYPIKGQYIRRNFQYDVYGKIRAYNIEIIAGSYQLVQILRIDYGPDGKVKTVVYRSPGYNVLHITMISDMKYDKNGDMIAWTKTILP